MKNTLQEIKFPKKTCIDLLRYLVNNAYSLRFALLMPPTVNYRIFQDIDLIRNTLCHLITKTRKIIQDKFPKYCYLLWFEVSISAGKLKCQKEKTVFLKLNLEIFSQQRKSVLFQKWKKIPFKLDDNGNEMKIYQFCTLFCSTIAMAVQELIIPQFY